MIIYTAVRAERWEGGENIAFCMTLDRAKLECQKDCDRWNQATVLEWKFEQDPWPQWVADLDDTASYVIRQEQILE